MRVVFIPRTDGPANLITEVELQFDDGPLAGLKLVGFSIWAGKDKGKYVTFPSRAFGAGNDRKYFDYLRSTDGSAHSVKNLKELILAELQRQWAV